VGRIQRAFAQQEVDQRPVRKRRVIAIDEFSIKKQHTYATVITDPIYKEIRTCSKITPHFYNRLTAVHDVV
jgi:transposase